MNPCIPSLGQEWIIDAWGCPAEVLRDRSRLEAVFVRVLAELQLNQVIPTVWHTFPGEGGITGMLLLAESHLTVHTFPEHGSVTLNLYCCTERPAWPWRERLAEMLLATTVEVRSLRRGVLSEQFRVTE